MDPGAYCREIETYLCRKNGGHLIRIAGPAFERVCGWAEAGVPLQIVIAGIDRKVARLEAAGGRRRPLRVEYCEADVLAAFDEWRRAVGVATVATRAGDGPVGDDTAPVDGEGPAAVGSRRSLPKHIERVLTQAANQLAQPERAPGLHAALEVTIRDLDALGDVRQARGAVRTRLVARLADIDRALVEATRQAAGASLSEIERDATAELAVFKTRMSTVDYRRAVRAGTDRTLRDRFRLPTVSF